MEDMLYWIIEYVKVFLGYGFFMFIWPLTIFKKYLKGKSVTYKFSFCVTSQVVMANTVVLVLGLVHVLNKWVMLVLFYGAFLYSIRHYFALTKERKTKIKYLVHGSFGLKNFIWLQYRKYKRKSEDFFNRIWSLYKKHWLEYSLLIVTIIYGMIYLSWGVFKVHSYGFGDMYVHHSWIHGLTEGTVFYDGVYPEAMHCVIYCLHTLFGIEIFSCMLYMAGIHVVILLIAVYCFMKEVFHWRYSGIFVLILFLTVDLLCFNEVFSMSRLQWTVPQEYGLYTIYLCALYIFKYLKSKPKSENNSLQEKGRGCWNENLLIVALALSASISIHFYVTIMAFFVCAAVALIKIKKIFHRNYFFPLVASVMAGVFVSVAPMAGALASGIPFQGSIDWAVSVMSGTGAVDSRAPVKEDKEEPEFSENVPSQNETVESPNTEITNSENVSSPVVNEEPLIQKLVNKIKQVWSFVKLLVLKIVGKIIEKIRGIYLYGYVDLYKQERARWIVGFTGVTTAICLIYFVISWIYAKYHKRKRAVNKFTEEYLIIISASFLVMVIYAAPLIGLPEIIAGLRLCSTEQLLILMVVILPIDMVFFGLSKVIKNGVLQFFSVIIAVGLAVGIYITGNYHGYMYFELTRYNQAVSTAVEIMEELPKYSYTIVSTTDEIYQVRQKGRHEEIVTFLKKIEEENYTLPTDYIFFFVEKKPLYYAQYYFFTGPEWLATQKYHAYYHEHSIYPNMYHAEISEEYAQKEMMFFSRPSQAYYDRASRTILESKMYQWCTEMREQYPNECKVFYEDDYFVCYYIRQNAERLYNLEWSE